MTWMEGVLRIHPELAFFVVLGLGHLIGRIALGGFKLGAVTGTLLAGVLVGQLGVGLSTQVQQCFFLLFLFAIGFRTGPQFFRGLRSDGLAHAALAAVVAVVGLLVAWGVSRAFGFDAGTSAGLLAGSLTESAAIGTAMDAIARLDVDDATRASLANQVPVAFAVTYLVGMTGAAWFLSQLAPRLMRVDLAEECRRLEQQMGGGEGAPMAVRRDFEVRAYAVGADSPFAGSLPERLEQMAGGVRLFVDRVRRNGAIVDPRDAGALRERDVVAVAGPRTALVEAVERPGSGLLEVDDVELLDVPGDVVDVIVTRDGIDGATLGELARRPESRGVFLRRISRGGTPLPVVAGTVVHRGDVMTIVGTATSTARAVEWLGIADRGGDTTDMLVVAVTIVAGALLGLPALRVGALELGLGLPVGVLLGGLVCGWFRSLRPGLVGRVPSPTLWIFESLGLTGFVAVVGLNAGPDFVRGVQETGVTLVVAAALTIGVSLAAGLVVGRRVFKMHPGVLLGVCAGACTATPALAAVQETARSSVPSIGYGVAYAVGNVLLALWGTVIVALTG